MPPRRRTRPPTEDEAFAACVAASVGDLDALSTLVFGRCWLESGWSADTRVQVLRGESLEQAATRHQLGWNPAWLYAADYVAVDAAGVLLADPTTPASRRGEITWDPPLRLPRVDDQTKDSAVKGSRDHRKRLAGEVLIAALWRSTARRVGVLDRVMADPALTGNSRGARFKKSIRTYLGAALPGWEFPDEQPLRGIFGLHLRRDVGLRSSDLLALRPMEPVPWLM